MAAVSALPSDVMVRCVNKTARPMKRSRADAIGKAIELVLADGEEQRSTLDRLSLPIGLTFDRDEVERRLAKESSRLSTISGSPRTSRYRSPAGRHPRRRYR